MEGLRWWDELYKIGASTLAGFMMGDRAWTKISGFLRTGEGLYERFEETAFNTVLGMENVRRALIEIGWREVYFARIQELGIPIENPEQESRVFIVARK